MTLSDLLYFYVYIFFAVSLRLLLQSDFGGIPSDFYLFCPLLWMVMQSSLLLSALLSCVIFGII